MRQTPMFFIKKYRRRLIHNVLAQNKSDKYFSEEYQMAKNKYKEYNMGVPVEKHDTAAWANIEAVKNASNVTMPSEIQVRNAKEHVDTNQK